jgi:hypothetical protein
MASTVYNLFTHYGLQPGVTVTGTWNNIPDGKAYALSANPWNPGSYQEGYDNTTKVEITRVWRRRRQIETPGSIGVDVEVHEDIQCQVKNIGTYPLNFTLYLIVFT